MPEIVRARLMLSRLSGIALVAAALFAVGPNAKADDAQPAGAQKVVLGVPCSAIQALGIDKQTNLRAGAIRVGCGLEPGGKPGLAAGASEAPTAPVGLPGNVDVITGLETYPHVTQSESYVSSSDGKTIVINYNDSRTAPSNYSGMSVSTDGGVTFTRFNPSPLATGHGTNFGDPIVVYDAKHGVWVAGDLASGCGGQGIGVWTSLDALTWTVGACAYNSAGGGGDRESMWVDNTPTSPFYGRMYISLNDFNIGGGALRVTHSDDAGVTWTAAATVNAGFIRDVQITGGPDGTVFLATMNENGGGFNPRQNFMYRSTDGGVTWSAAISMGAAFSAPGDFLCSTNSYFVNVNPIWRHMGWGQPGAGPNGVVHYAYAGHGVATGDTGDIYYVRSADNGLTWSPPIVLNTDQALGGTKTQWMPSLSVTPSGDVVAYWYDRRNTTDGVNYEVWSRRSRDNGLTWLQDERVTTSISPQPLQPDPNVQSCYAGDYNYSTAYGHTHHLTWTDGRATVSGNSQQDVNYASVPAEPILCCKDFNGDGRADIFWRNAGTGSSPSLNGNLVEWQLNGFAVTAAGSPGNPGPGWKVVGLGDFNGDGMADILWRDTNGNLYMWLMGCGPGGTNCGFTIIGSGTPGPGVTPPTPGPGTNWQVAGVGDFNGDGKADILWRDGAGNLFIWLMNGLTAIATGAPSSSAGEVWQIQGIGDFNGDGKADILWRNTSTGEIVIWQMNGTSVTAGSVGVVSLAWRIVGVGDFNGDGKADILWRYLDGTAVIWEMDGFSLIASGATGSFADNTWQVAGIGDINGDGKSDIVWRRTTGDVVGWLMNGFAVSGGFIGAPSNDWEIE